MSKLPIIQENFKQYPQDEAVCPFCGVITDTAISSCWSCGKNIDWDKIFYER